MSLLARLIDAISLPRPWTGVSDAVTKEALRLGVGVRVTPEGAVPDVTVPPLQLRKETA